jgi:formate dehydrogenase subunit gamma
MVGHDAQRAAASDRLVRHAGIDRLVHWIVAASVLVLMGTAFLPIVGFDFAWVTVHWVSGLVLTAAVVFHIVRALIWQERASMWIGARDLRDFIDVLKWTARMRSNPPAKPGKYSLAQKLTHLFFTLLVLTGVVTGILLLTKIDTPWWQRDPYWLSEDVWGVLYVAHDLVALCLISIVIVHVYFALRPEKLRFTRSMILGWITRDEYRAHHDPERWQIER